MTGEILKFDFLSSEARKPLKIFQQFNVKGGPNWVRGGNLGEMSGGEKKR